MIIAGKSIAVPVPFLRHTRVPEGGWHTIAHMQLTRAFQAAQEIPFDNSSRIVLLSDCHRGNRGRTDAFASNGPLFLSVLDHYYRHGFTYIEVGDGDELWKHRRFSEIRRAYPYVFDMMQMFHQEQRLHLIFGNHDIASGSRVEKDGILAHEALVLKHAGTGQRILVLHGHQADFRSNHQLRMSRFIVRHVWKRVQQLGLGKTPLWGGDGRNKLERTIRHRMEAYKDKIEYRIMTWAGAHQQMVICGHTHCASYAARGEIPYFNTGNCTLPGQLTGLEIQNGQIALVHWSTPFVEKRSRELSGEIIYAERQLVAPPQGLHLFN